MQNNQKVGIDIIGVARFKEYESDREHVFLKKVFHKEEIDYCFSFSNPSVHLAGMFALKEAVSKALGTDVYPFAEVCVHHQENGAPYVSHNGNVLPVATSISHTDELATAIAIG